MHTHVDASDLSERAPRNTQGIGMCAFSAANQHAGLGHRRIDAADRTVNRSVDLVHVLGLGPQETRVVFETHIACYHPNDRAHVAARIEAILDERAPPTHYQGRARIVRPDGGVRRIIILGSPETDAGGRLIALSGPLCAEPDLGRSTRLHGGRIRSARSACCRMRPARSPDIVSG